MKELPPRPLLKAQEVADFFDVDIKTVYNWANCFGILPRVKIGTKTVRFKREDILNFKKPRNK